jgi:hypothetical protein
MVFWWLSCEANVGLNAVDYVGFHRHVVDALLAKPAGQCQRIASEAAEHPDLPALLTVRLTNKHAGTHRLLVYIQSSTRRIHPLAWLDLLDCS